MFEVIFLQYKSNILKLILFFLIVSFCLAVTTTLLCAYPSEAPFLTMMVLGFISGPFFSIFLVRKKGVYSGCILLIFMTETALLCSSLYNIYYTSLLSAYFLLGAALTSTLFLCPIITHYLRGQANYIKVLPLTLTSTFIGFLLANPLTLLPEEILYSKAFTLSTIFLLLGSFFTVFSAWKHRLVLLK